MGQDAEQTGGADLPPAQPPEPANAAPETGSGAAKSARIGVWPRIVALLGIFCVVGGLLLLRGAVLPAYEYLRGTATTATVGDCVSHTGGTCDGRWSVGGVSQTGPIHGVYDRHDRVVGSQVDVHVRGATAYTASYASLAYTAMSWGCVALATGLVLLWSVRRKYRTGNWPLSGRRFKVFGRFVRPDRKQPT
jgi:hypothetical protein